MKLGEEKKAKRGRNPVLLVPDAILETTILFSSPCFNAMHYLRKNLFNGLRCVK